MGPISLAPRGSLASQKSLLEVLVVLTGVVGMSMKERALKPYGLIAVNVVSGWRYVMVGK